MIFKFRIATRNQPVPETAKPCQAESAFRPTTAELRTCKPKSVLNLRPRALKPGTEILNHAYTCSILKTIPSYLDPTLAGMRCQPSESLLGFRSLSGGFYDLAPHVTCTLQALQGREQTRVASQNPKGQESQLLTESVAKREAEEKQTAHDTGVCCACFLTSGFRSLPKLGFGVYAVEWAWGRPTARSLNDALVIADLYQMYTGSRTRLLLSQQDVLQVLLVSFVIRPLQSTPPTPSYKIKPIKPQP